MKRRAYRRRGWTHLDHLVLEALYPHVRTERIAQALGHSLPACYNMARKLGLAKSDEYLASPDACRLRRGGENHPGRSTQFPKGHVPANKGLRRPGWAPGRMAETQFRKGERRGVAAENYCPLGTIRTDPEGYQRIKVRDALAGEPTGFGNTKVWPLLQRHIWEQNHGPIPPGHTVVFRDGNRANCDIANLELISRAELMRRNTIHRYPETLRNTILLLGALKRKVREHAEKHND